MLSSARELVEIIVKQEFLEEDAIDAFKLLGSLVSLDFISPDHKQCKFTIRGDTDGESVETFRVYLRVIKGSILTNIWNMLARFDDEYAVYAKGGHTNIIQDDDGLLWYLKWVDIYEKKLVEGNINWFFMYKLHEFTKLQSIGVLAFSKMLGRIIMSLPCFVFMKQYVVPMPIAFMFNYLVVVESTPLELSVSTHKQAEYKEVLNSFRGNDGGGVILKQYFPFWNAHSGKKELCHLFTVHQGYFPVGNVQKFSDVVVRVVEIREHPLGAHGMIAILEVVHKWNWWEIVRYVTLDIFHLQFAIGDRKELEIGSSFQNILIIDEVEWQQKCIEFRQQKVSLKNVNIVPEEDEEVALNTADYINFRNTCTWGAVAKVIPS